MSVGYVKRGSANVGGVQEASSELLAILVYRPSFHGSGVVHHDPD